jgi:DNA-binding SARP family transcriptional activator
MEFRLLGALEVINDGEDITPTAPKLREVLALLVLHANQLVRIESLIDELWGDNPPVSALSTLQTYIYKLRKVLFDRVAGITLVTKPAGYLAMVPPECVDVCAFEESVAEGLKAMERGDATAAAQALATALARWRGPALADVLSGSLLTAHGTRLEERKLTAIELRIEAELKLGRHIELISELKELTSANPYHEGLHTKLMLALYRAGRRGEALESYRQVRSVLVDELGVEPSPQTMRMQQCLLTSDPALDNVMAPVPAPRAVPTLSTPAQLPPDIADFAGRRSEVSRAEQLITCGSESGTAVRVVLITGMPGVGKTVLGVRAAHRAASRFPGGQLFADLGSPGRTPSSPAAILWRFLRAAGFRPDEIPDCTDERSKLFRTWTARHAALIFLDDAVSAAQVIPLLPGSPYCGVVVTSRSRLPGLPGACHVELDVFTVAEGVELLANIAGRGRVDADVRAAEQLVELCGRLPLAIRSVGAKLAATPGWPIAKLIGMLGASRSRLDQLACAGYDIRTRFDASYQRLSEPDKGAFRLLGLLRDGEFTEDRVAALLGCSPPDADDLLARLVDHRLLRVTGHGPGGIRYGFHQFARLYARDRLQELLTGEDRADLRPVARAALHMASTGPPGSGPAQPTLRELADAPVVAGPRHHAPGDVRSLTG